MRIVIAGGTGFIGQSLAHHFLSQHHELVIIGRDKDKIFTVYKKNSLITPFTWDEFEEQKKDVVLTADLIINLTGANIAEKRWSTKRKQEILDSRVLPTRTLANSCAIFGKDSPPLFNASAVGLYGLQKPITSTLPKPFKESDNLNLKNHSDFISKVGHAWEEATYPARDQGVRVVNMRFALVLDKKGLLAKLYPLFKLGLGGPIGSGNQPFPFIALSDLIAAVEFLIQHPLIRGPVNFVAPQCIQQKQFATAFASVLKKPGIMPTPAFLLKMVYGEMAEELLLNGQCAYPEVLLANGFKFKYPTIDATLQHIFK